MNTCHVVLHHEDTWCIILPGWTHDKITGNDKKSRKGKGHYLVAWKRWSRITGESAPTAGYEDNIHWRHGVSRNENNRKRRNVSVWIHDINLMIVKDFTRVVTGFRPKPIKDSCAVCLLLVHIFWNAVVLKTFSIVTTEFVQHKSLSPEGLSFNQRFILFKRKSHNHTCYSSTIGICLFVIDSYV